MKFSKLRLFLVSVVAGIFALGTYAVASIQLGGSIFPLTYTTGSPVNPTDAFNQMESLINQQVAAAPANPAYIVGVSTNQQFNPLMQVSVASNSAELVNSTTTNGAVLISGVTGRTIYPLNPTVMASGGNAATATSEAIVCEPSGTLVATFPIAALVQNVPVATFSSVSAVLPGKAAAAGCSAGDGVFLSTIGSGVTGASSFTTNVPYIVQ